MIPRKGQAMPCEEHLQLALSSSGLKDKDKDKGCSALMLQEGNWVRLVRDDG